MRLAEQVGLAEEERSALFYALLLKDAGCSANASRLSSLFDADDHADQARDEGTRLVAPRLARRCTRGARSSPGGGPLAKARQMRRITQEDEVTREMIGTRCERGAEIARMLELPEDTRDAIRALDEHWDGSGQPLGLRGEEIPLLGRILCLAQTRRGVRAHDRPARRLRHGDQAARPLVRPGAGRRAARRSATTRAFWGPLEDARDGAAGGGVGAGRPRADAPATTGSTASPTRSRA